MFGEGEGIRDTAGRAVPRFRTDKKGAVSRHGERWRVEERGKEEREGWKRRGGGESTKRK